MLSHREKSMLTLLTSDVQAEWMRAAKLQHRVYSEALRAASRPAFHRARGWWSFEVQHNVSQHMGWLPKALARGILKKVSRGHGIKLGQQGLKYRILPLTPQLAQKIQRHGSAHHDVGRDAGAEDIRRVRGKPRYPVGDARQVPRFVVLPLLL